MDGEWLEEVYRPEELTPGCKVSLPWQSKKRITYWSAVVVDLTAGQDEVKAPVKKRAIKRQGVYTHLSHSFLNCFIPYSLSNPTAGQGEVEEPVKKRT